MIYDMPASHEPVDQGDIIDGCPVPDYYGDTTRRELTIELADYLARKLEALRPEEARAARIVTELVKNQRLG